MDNPQKENTVPIYLKYAITVEGASILTGIGTKTLYKLINANRNPSTSSTWGIGRR